MLLLTVLSVPLWQKVSLTRQGGQWGGRKDAGDAALARCQRALRVHAGRSRQHTGGSTSSTDKQSLASPLRGPGSAPPGSAGLRRSVSAGRKGLPPVR
jgi:hypothetical protein